MSTTNPVPLKPSKPSLTTPSPPLYSTTLSSKSSSSLSSHFAMIELKQRILTSLSKLSDRDTHQIAIEDLEKIIQTLTVDATSMLLNCLYEASSDPKPAVKKEALRLLALLATSHSDSTSTHLTKIISHVIRCLKDSDSGVRDSCRDTIGALSNQYLRGESENGNLGSVVALFVKPLVEAFGEQKKVVQAGAALCMARMVESAKDPPIATFQKLCPRVCKFLNNENFLAKAALLSVVSSLSQVGAIAAQSFPSLMQSVHECLENSDWATRKAAADTLSVLASHSSHLVTDGAASTITALEACRFDKVKPVRDSMTEALQLWKKTVGKGGDKASEDPKTLSHDGKNSELTKSVEKSDLRKSNPSDKASDPLVKDASSASSPTSNSLCKVKGSTMSDKTVCILRKKAPVLSDKELNPEFFQKLETRGSGELPVEVVVPRRCLHSSRSQSEEESELNDCDYGGGSNHSVMPGHDSNDIHGSASINFINIEKRAGPYNKVHDLDDSARDKLMEQRVLRGKNPKTRGFDADDRVEINQGDSGARVGLFRSDGHSEGSFSKGNWLAIQRQLSQLERQQANLTKMLQDFMEGSHDSMVTLENRVRGLERIVEEMAHDLALSSGRRGSNLMMGFEGSSGRPSGKYNGLHDYSSSKLGRGGDGRIPFAERYLSSEGFVSGVRGRDPPWRPDPSEAWDSYAHGPSRNGHVSSRRALGGVSNDGRLPRTDHNGDQVGNRRVWDKGPGPVRLGEGPSARSVWQASKDEATLQAIRVAGEDGEISRTATREAIPEAEALADDNPGQERGPLWASWSHAMDLLHAGDMDSSYSEVLSTGDDLLLLKLMDRSGPVLDQLSNEIASEVLHAIGQFLLDQRLFDIGLSWIQQLAELIMENGPDFLGIPIEVKRELLWSLHEASTMEPPEDWEGATVHQLMLQLASTWGINLQQLEK
ncbi:microtubule-associated protein TORTIFOLIA1-like [Tasmannia lanceolata]|uniref:microtubule-associated protein TORTIFOLIA1-like n=1 Tax=Tasmannia lanceolata TaxID=3420 RepID=UPI0040637617